MGIEIERKFLVKANMVLPMLAQQHFHTYHISQGYILEDEESKKAARVRTTRSFDQHGNAQNKAYLTIKKGGRQVISRTEFEYEIPYEDGEYMLLHVCDAVLNKKRTIVPYSGEYTGISTAEYAQLAWEIDCFTSDVFGLQGLILAEIELSRPDCPISLPKWIADEVTEDPEYLNSNLIKSINT